MSETGRVDRIEWEKKALNPAVEALAERYKTTCENRDKLLLQKQEYEDLIKKLKNLADEVTHPVMVPIGSIAFMPGKLIHTNEIRVFLGENYFAETSTKHAAEIARRRLQFLSEEVNRLEKEKDEITFELDQITEMKSELHGAIDGEVFDIQEPYTDEDEARDRERYPHLFNREPREETFSAKIEPEAKSTENSLPVESSPRDTPASPSMTPENKPNAPKTPANPPHNQQSSKKKKKKKTGKGKHPHFNHQSRIHEEESTSHDEHDADDAEQRSSEDEVDANAIRVRFSNVKLGKTCGVVTQVSPKSILKRPPQSPKEFSEHLERMKDRYNRAHGDVQPDYLPMYNPKALEQKKLVDSPKSASQNGDTESPSPSPSPSPSQSPNIGPVPSAAPNTTPIGDIVVEREIVEMAPLSLEASQLPPTPAPEKRVSKFKAARQKK